jgi:uncharacterized membrane protein
MSNSCPNCLAAIDADAVFCMACGNPVSQMILCPKCRGTLTKDAKFCKFCAFDLSLPAPVATGDLPPISNPQVFAAPPTMAMPVVSAENQAGAPSSPIISIPEQEDKRAFITPSTAAFAVICFFLPWVEYSWGGYGERSFSGADLAGLDGSLWLILLAAAGIVGAFFYFRSQKRLPAGIPVAMGATTFALNFLFYKIQSYGRGVDTPFGNVGFEMLGFSLQIGGFLMAASLLAAWLGCYFLLPAESVPNRKLSSGKASAICYLLFPLPYLLWLIAPLVFIFVEPYKRDKFIRFHAIQVVLLGVGNIAVMILLMVFFGLFDLTKPFYERGRGFMTAALLMVFITTAFYALAGYLAYKSAMNQKIKLMFLGDLAEKWVEKEIPFPKVNN